MARFLTWLHISDLHAGHPDIGWDARRVTTALCSDLNMLNTRFNLRPDLIFFTGDAAYGHISNHRGEAISDQFREADAFFTEVRKLFIPEVPKRNLFIVPGNHDVNRSQITTMEKHWLRLPHSLTDVETLIRDSSTDWHHLMKRLSDYAQFLEGYGYDHLLTGRERLIYADMRTVFGVRVGIAGFNSAWSSAGEGQTEMGNLWMGGRFQLETLREQMPQHDIAIALVHHPGSWLVPEENPSLYRELHRDFQFVLHGHEHSDFVNVNAQTGHAIISAGACHDWSQGNSNGYNIVRLDLDAGIGEVWMREYESTGAGWRPRIITNMTDSNGVSSVTAFNHWLANIRPSDDVEYVETRLSNNTSRERALNAQSESTDGDPAADYEMRYCHAVSQRLDYVHLFGIDIPRESTEYSLSVAYVSLNMADETINPTADASQAGLQVHSSSPSGPSDEELNDGLESTLSAEDFFDQINSGANRLLIRGAAGCGKTTLLHWAAVQAARTRRTREPAAGSGATAEMLSGDGILEFDITQDDHDEAGLSFSRDRPRSIRKSWKSYVPFVVRLRDYADKPLPRPHEYALKLANELPDAPADWMADLLESGRALLMFDGADELPIARRNEVIGELRHLMNTYPNCAFVLTARPEAVELDYFREHGFKSARIAHLSQYGRNVFIDRWHEAMELRLRNRSEPQDLRPVASRLKQQLAKSPAVARLTINPLLCASICALHWKRSENLPETPVELCEKLCDMLIDRRDRERPGNIEPQAVDAAYSRLDYGRRKGLLSRLAHKMVITGVSSITEKEADSELIAGLAAYAPESTSASHIRKILVERSGVLQESKHQTIEFLHNTLKEFLAAERFANRGEHAIMAKHCHEESWQPVILFALALPRESSSFATSLLVSLYDRVVQAQSSNSGSPSGRGTKPSLQSLQFFFLRACGAAHQIADKRTRTAFASLSESLLPPKSNSDAEALASCGEAVVPYLAASETLSERERAACIAALARIGGERATKLLYDHGKIATKGPANAFRELMLNNPSLAGEVQPELYGLKGVTLREAALDDLKVFTNVATLQELDIRNSNVSDLSPLAKLYGLKRIDLENTRVRDISILAGLRNLEQVNLRNAAVEDISSLAALAHLRQLNLDGTLVSSLGGIERCRRLIEVSLRDSPCGDISALAGSQSLVSLMAARSSLDSLGVLKDIETLANLDVSGTDVEDLSPLENIQSLALLDITDCRISSLRPIGKLANLRTLRMRGTFVTNVAALAGCLRLREVSLDGSRIEDISSVRSLIERGVRVSGVSM